MSLEDKLRKHGNHIYRNPKDAEKCLSNYYPVGIMIVNIKHEEIEPTAEVLGELALNLERSFEVGSQYCFFDEVEFTEQELAEKLKQNKKLNNDFDQWIQDIDEAYLMVNKLYSFNEINAPDLNPGEKGEMR